MDLPSFICERPRDHVATITINRPEGRNAINTPAHKEWSDLLDQVAGDDEPWIVVITGGGDQAFCAGRDLTHLTAMRHAAPDERQADAAMMASVTRLIERCDFPTPLLARVNGVALGGGFAVAQACDLVEGSRSGRRQDSGVTRVRVRTWRTHGPRERSAIIDQQSRLLQSREVPPARHLGPLRNIVKTLDIGARNHQGLGNQLIAPEQAVGRVSGPVKRQTRLGGMLSYYYREVA